MSHPRRQTAVQTGLTHFLTRSSVLQFFSSSVLLWSLVSGLWSLPAEAAVGDISSVAGGGVSPGNGGAATLAALNNPAGVALDAAGNRYIAEYGDHRIRKVDTAGTITRVAGDGFAGFYGDGGPAISAALNNPVGVFVDPAGNLYIADRFNHRIRKVDTAGIITTVAGTGVAGFSGDGGLAISAALNQPFDVARDAAGNLYIADLANHRIRKVATTGIITTVAGTGVAGYLGDGGAATSARLNSPSDVTFDAAGNLFIADAGNNRIRKVTTAGIISTFAGTGVAGFLGDGGAATSARLNSPISVAMDAVGTTLYIADYTNHRIRKVATTGIITTVAGTGVAGYLGDGGAATSARLNSPIGIVADSAGNLVIGDFGNHRIRQVSPAGIITTTAGNGTTVFTGDGGPAATARLSDPYGVLVDPTGNLYIADATNNRIRKVDTAGTITTVAGTGTAGFSGDGGAATSAALNFPSDVAVDAAGTLYIADYSNHRIRKVTTAGIISTFAGTGVAGYSGDGGAATSAGLNNPYGVLVDSAGNLYIADRNNHRIRKVSPGGIITTVAGTGVAGYSGDGGAATSAGLNQPFDVALDGAGNLYITDESNNRVRKVTLAGIITTVAGIGGFGGFSGDGGPATSAAFNIPTGVAVDAAGNFYIADSSNSRIRKVDTAGTITTVAGNGTSGFSGDGGPATSAALYLPSGVALDATGTTLYITDNQRVRKVLLPDTTPPAAPTGLKLTVGADGASITASATAPADSDFSQLVWRYTSVAGHTSPTYPANSTSGTSFGAGTTTGAPSSLQSLTASSLAGSNTYAVRVWAKDVAGNVSAPASNYVYLVDIITTVAGTGTAGFLGDGGAATGARLNLPWGVAVDATGNLYIVDYNNQRIRKVDTLGVISTVAGTGVFGFSGDGGAATSANLNFPYGIALDAAGTLYIADEGNQRIRKVNTSGVISTAAGTGAPGFSGDGGAATSANLWNPNGVALDAAGNFYIADQGNSRIRKVDTAGTITTVAGTGTAGFSGDGGAATGARLNTPTGVALDAAGNLYIADQGNSRIRKVDTLGVISTAAGTGVFGFSGDGGAATSANLWNPDGVALDAAGNFYIADRDNNRIRKVDTAGIITTVAGTGTAGFSGDGGAATSAALKGPRGVALDAAGNLYIADYLNSRIRRVGTPIDTTPPAAPTGLTLIVGADGASITASATAPADSDFSQLVWRYASADGNTSPFYPANAAAGTAFGAGITTGAPSSLQSLTASSLAALKTYSVRVWATDAVGNVSVGSAQQFLYLGPPSPRLVISTPTNLATGGAVAGSPLTLTITAKDANSNVLTAYAGPYSLSWTPSGAASATTLVSSSALGWSSGVASTTVTIGGSDAGPGTFTAVDNSANGLANGTLAFRFYPASFTVTTTSASFTAGDPFTLTVTAKDSAAATVSRYSGTANTSLVYVNPSSGMKGLSLTLLGPTSFANGIAAVTLHYPDAGQIQITARDTSYVTGVTIQGTSATLTFTPKAFAVIPMPLPAFLTRPYVSQPFEVLVVAMAADGVTVTDNYTGTVTLEGVGFSLVPTTHTFVPLVDRGRATIKDVKAASAGSGVLKATDGLVTGQSLPFGVRAATLVLNSVTGKPGTLMVSAYIKDTATNLPVHEDVSTRFAVTINDQSAGTPATSPDTSSLLMVTSGMAAIKVTKPEEGTATVSATVQGFSMPVQPATVIWSNSAGTTSSTTTFQVLQFEQAPSTSITTSTTTTYQQPTSGSLSTTTSATPPPNASGSSTSSYTLPTGFLMPPMGFSPDASTGAFTPPPGYLGNFTMGGTRYDAAVSMGYSLVAPNPSRQGFGLPAGQAGVNGMPGGPAGFSGMMLGPPPAMRSKMEGKQFNVIMGGMQSGGKPEGVESVFGPELGGGALHQEFNAMAGRAMQETGPMMPKMDMSMMGPAGTEAGMPPAWLMGPGSNGRDEGVMVFDSNRGGWLRENSGMSGVVDKEDHGQESAEEGEPDTAAPDATTQESAESPTTSDPATTPAPRQTKAPKD